ncbi:hypothetical protein PC9H_011171 [Pleurotus ostreatus]|uniref:Uncharacterized protein n=1 Tax=Pleurotus ostreatus TaxID=5322 RepID=A0A8H6ZT15_PLEOS|nr:uncharacterized protein PC9H_011171 [Pleurotus ostreatus]KAF7423007.1 hypothetical protein PC9H_011171 [Pleurotus ostreatus]
MHHPIYYFNAQQNAAKTHLGRLLLARNAAPPTAATQLHGGLAKPPWIRIKDSDATFNYARKPIVAGRTTMGFLEN